MSDILFTLRGDGYGSWFITFELEGRDATVFVGAAIANYIVRELDIPFTEPNNKNAVSYKEAAVKAQAWIYNDLTTWFLDIVLPDGLKYTIMFSNEPKRVSKLLELGIKQKPITDQPKEPANED
jgi:hypothetical protein